MGTLWLQATRPTLSCGELDLDDVVRPLIDGGCPTDAGVPCWADRLLTLPIGSKIRGCKPLSRPRLPMAIIAGRTDKINPILLGARDQQFRIDIAGVDAMRGR